MIADRRHALSLLLAGLASPAAAQTLSMKGSAMSPVTAYAFSFAGLKLKLELAQGQGDHVIMMKAAKFKVFGQVQPDGMHQLHVFRAQRWRMRAKAILNRGPRSINEFQ